MKRKRRAPHAVAINGKRIARVLHNATVPPMEPGHVHARFCVAELDGATGEISIRLEGCRTRATYKATDLFTGQLVKPQLTLTGKPTVDFKGEKRPLAVDLDMDKGTITVRPNGIRRGAKTYNLADLFTWGPQLQLI